MTNAERAEIGKALVAHYALLMGYSKQTAQAEENDIITDAISNLMHFARTKELDVQGVMFKAINHFTAEVNGIGCCRVCGEDSEECDCSVEENG